MGVVDELDETLTSEQRRLLCLALQHQQEYDEDYEPSFDSDSEAEEEQTVRVRTIINVTRPPLLYVVLPIVMQALVSIAVIAYR